MATTVLQIITQAYVEVNVIQDTSESISTTLRDDALLVLQQGYSRSSAERLLAYLVVHGGPYTVVAGTSSYTVGTGGTFTTSARPVAMTGWKSISGAFQSRIQPRGRSSGSSDFADLQWGLVTRPFDAGYRSRNVPSRQRVLHSARRVQRSRGEN